MPPSVPERVAAFALGALFSDGVVFNDGINRESASETPPLTVIFCCAPLVTAKKKTKPAGLVASASHCTHKNRRTAVRLPGPHRLGGPEGRRVPSFQQQPWPPSLIPDERVPTAVCCLLRLPLQVHAKAWLPYTSP